MGGRLLIPYRLHHILTALSDTPRFRAISRIGFSQTSFSSSSLVGCFTLWVWILGSVLQLVPGGLWRAFLGFQLNNLSLSCKPSNLIGVCFATLSSVVGSGRITTGFFSCLRYLAFDPSDAVFGNDS